MESGLASLDEFTGLSIAGLDSCDILMLNYHAAALFAWESTHGNLQSTEGCSARIRIGGRRGYLCL